MKQKNTVQIIIPPYGMRVSIPKPSVQAFKDAHIAAGMPVDRRSLGRVFHAARPGKTEKDKKNGHRPYTKNRRVWTGRGPSDPAGEWVKVGG